MVSLKQIYEVLYRLRHTVSTIATAVGLIPTTDHFALIPPEYGPYHLDAAGGGAPQWGFVIPAGANWFRVGSSNAARTAPLTGYTATSENGHLKTGPVYTLADSGLHPIVIKMDDNATAPTRIYVENTGVNDGYVWVEFYR